jgi:hypothetical protein
VRRFAPFLPLPLLVALAAWSSGRLADAAGERIAGALVSISQVLARAEARDPEPEVELPSELAAPTVRLTAAGPTTAPLKPSKRRAATKASPAARGVFVSAETVLKLANRRVVPRGIAVKAEGKRPAGLRLMNVTGLGIGLRDGDVLTRAVGLPALSSGAVVQAVLMARSQRARFLDGEFWRDGERYTLRVEQPYPNAP